MRAHKGLMSTSRSLLSSGKTVLERTRYRSSGNHLLLSERFLPSKDYAESFSGRWHEVLPPVAPQRSAPIRHGRRAVDLASMLEPVPALGVLELQEASILGPNGWIISREGHLLPQHSWYGVKHVDEMRIPKRPIDVAQLRGVCLSLASDWASVNYGHFLLDGLCRFELFRKAGFSVADVDHIYCPLPFPRLDRFLARLGIPKEKHVTVGKGSAVRADVVLAPSFPGTRWNYQSWAVDFLQKTFLRSPAVPHRRLYIPRDTRRRITNEQQLIAIMKKRDFEIFDPAGSKDPPAHFAEAEVVVGGHGAGLADLAFCSRETRVLELMPSDHIRPYWYTLSDATGLRYGYLLGESAGQRPSGSLGPSPYDLYVDEREFDEALTQTIGV